MCRSRQFADGTWNVPATLRVTQVPLANVLRLTNDLIRGDDFTAFFTVR